jgi:hypothetical protein
MRLDFDWEVLMKTKEQAPNLTDSEWRLIAELLESECRRLPTEIHHTRTGAFREELRRRLVEAEQALEHARGYLTQRTQEIR